MAKKAKPVTDVEIFPGVKVKKAGLDADGKLIMPEGMPQPPSDMFGDIGVILTSDFGRKMIGSMDLGRRRSIVEGLIVDGKTDDEIRSYFKSNKQGEVPEDHLAAVRQMIKDLGPKTSRKSKGKGKR